MYESLVNFDRNLFLALNSFYTPFMDSVMWWVADRFIWIPFYALLAFFLYRKFGQQAIIMILFASVLILLSDQISVMIKNIFERERPCHDQIIGLMAHTINNKCGGKFGFVSSHAANTMAVFTYLLLLTRNVNRYVTLITGLWVLLVGYCRIYMGVHYPADILGGWMVGIFAAVVTYLLYRLISNSPLDDMKQE